MWMMKPHPSNPKRYEDLEGSNLEVAIKSELNKSIKSTLEYIIKNTF